MSCAGEPTPGNVGTDPEADSGSTDHTQPAAPLVDVAMAPGADALVELNADLLTEELADAERLLRYAVDTGAQVDPVVFRNILEAGAAARTGWTEHAGTKLLSAAATLAAMLKPVSAESLRICADYRKSWVRRMWGPVATVILAALIVLYSTAAFLFSSFSANIRDSIAVANPLAVKLIDELGPADLTNDKLCPISGAPTASYQESKSTDPSLPPKGINRKDVVQDLQTFAAAIRDMYGGARRTNRLYPFSSKQPDPYDFSSKQAEPYDGESTTNNANKVLELPPGLPNLALAAAERVCVYQRVRYYAQSTEENATIFTGAFATCILPVLYALLGACAYVLRRLESQLRSNTFTADMHSPRFVTAVIVGAVVGLFNLGQAVSVSPLAIAFLAGYAVDVFFTFLESLIQTLIRARDNARSDRLPPTAKT
jgi:hypothetical protein